MMVREAIEKLKVMPQDARLVVFCDGDGGLDDIYSIESTHVKLNANIHKAYVGPHDEDENGDVEAVCIR